MGRRKGFKLTAEHKRKMAEGRKKAKEKAMEGMIEGQEEVRGKKKKKYDQDQRVVPDIIGYGIDKGDRFPYPVFRSERKSFAGVLYSTPIEALESVKGRTR
jgi:hypothetical protein